MPKIFYTSKKFSDLQLQIIERANTIIASYAAEGYDLTLRQLYYQFVSRDWFPDSWKDPATGSTNNDKSYDKLGDIVSDARRAGLIDWEAIVDRTRTLRTVATWEDPAEIVNGCSRQFKIDMWGRQRYRPEIWVEKDALVGVLEVACRDWRVPYSSCRGYVSDSMVWAAARRLAEHESKGQVPIVFHLGDHDPSGIDMSRDIFDRINLFAECPVEIEVRRIALTHAQVLEVNPPNNPAKVTDARFRGYRQQYGAQCWELDALSPQYIRDLIENEIRDIVDDDLWQEDRTTEQQYRSQLSTVSRNWDKAHKHVSK